MASTVPVVYGSDDAHKLVPPKSYIDVRNFNSPKELAEYILYLDRNLTAYQSYFNWKDHYQVHNGHYSITTVFCKFCTYLYTEKKTKIVKDFKHWFYNLSKCRKPDILIS